VTKAGRKVRTHSPGWQLLLLPIVAIFPILIFALLVVAYFSAEKERQLESQLVATAASATEAGDLILARYLTSLDMLAGSAASEPAFTLQANRLVHEHQWLAIELLDENAAPLLAISRAGAPQLSAAGTARPQSVLPNTTVSAVVSLAADSPFLLLQQDAEREGTSVRAALPLEPFSEAMRSLDAPDGWVVALLGPGNRIAGRSRAQEEHVGKIATPSLVAMLGSPGQTLFYSTNQEGEPVYTAVSRSSLTGWKSAVGAPAALARQIISQARLWLAGGALLATAIAGLLAWLVIATIRRTREAERRALEAEGERRAEARLQDIASNFPGVLYRRMLHPDGSISFPFISSHEENPFIRSLNRLKGRGMAVEQTAQVYATSEAQVQFVQEIRRTAATSDVFEFEGPIAGDDGKITWVRSLASTHRLSDGTIVWDGALLDITELKETADALQQRTLALQTVHSINLHLAAELDVQRLTQAVTDAATKLVGASFGAFFHNPRNDSTTYQLFTLSGAEREAFAGFAMPRHTEVFGPTLRGEGTILSNDITADPRYGKNDPHFGMPKGHLPVRSYLAVPVKSRSGEVLGGLFFGHPDAGVFDAAAAQAVEGIAAQTAVAMDNARMFEEAQSEIEHRRQSEEHQRLLLAELNHRVKNTLAVVVSIADQTARSSRDREEFMTGFRRRLIAISDGHTLLSDSEWKGASLRALIARALQAHAHGGEQYWHISGPEVTVAPRQAIALSLALHELAAKSRRTRGNLSPTDPEVRVQWQPSEDQAWIDLVWQEPSASLDAANQDKFGNILIDLNVRYECEGTISRSLNAKGFTCTITLPWDPLDSRIAVAQKNQSSSFYRS
jgi:two-component sensor histidine kinase